jgi:hypothetical protein
MTHVYNCAEKEVKIPLTELESFKKMHCEVTITITSGGKTLENSLSDQDFTKCTNEMIIMAVSEM